MQANLAMNGPYMEAHDIDSEINKQIENKELNKYKWNYKSYEKKNRQHIKLLQILEWNTATESAHTETGEKTFWVGRKKRILVHVNGRLEMLELEWVLCATSGQVGTVHLA